MNEISPLFGVYLITDGNSEGAEELARKTALALAGGCRCVQLREKGLAGGPLLKAARLLRISTREYGARLLVNDRIDVALLSDADGVHLGQKSVRVRDAREILGPRKLIGVSTHGLKEALKAEKDGADFITLGPVYPTPSKAAYGSPVGIEVLKEVTEAVTIPVYAIGGIKKERIKEVVSAGARGVAVIRAVMDGPDIEKSAAALVEELRYSLSGC